MLVDLPVLNGNKISPRVTLPDDSFPSEDNVSSTITDEPISISAVTSWTSPATEAARVRTLLKKENAEADELWGRLRELLGTLTSKDRRTKAARAQLLADGLDYDQAFLVRFLTVETDQLTRLPNGFWTTPDTAKNMIFVTLDTIPGFKDAREKNDVKIMANLYRKHVINYEAKDKKKYKQNGQKTFFDEIGGLRGLMNTHKDFLSKNSPASMLRFALPGLIDDANIDALKSREVERNTNSN